MRLPTWMVSVALGVSLACTGGDEEPEAGVPAEAEAAGTPAAVDTTAVEQQTPDTGQQTAATEQQTPGTQPPEDPPQVPERRTAGQITVAPRAQQQAVDEPWTPEFTGTVSPGMSRDEVVAAWGEPVVERTAGEHTFMYFRNGCEVTCGTYDVVFLQGGQVVDAIVRFDGHTYTGVSSSPADRLAEFTPPVPVIEGDSGSS